jgi:hypothetical protein
MRHNQVLLGYLPRDPTTWDQILSDRRAIYQQWIKDLIIDPHENVCALLPPLPLPLQRIR